MQFQVPPRQPDMFSQFRGIFNGFLAGLIVGVLIGWFFHGVVSLFVRFGLFLLLLIPLLLIGLFLWRSRQAGRVDAPDQGDRGGMRVYTWRNDRGAGSPLDVTPNNASRPTFRRAEPEPEPQPEATARQSRQEIIDLEFEELKRDVDGEKSP